MIKNHIFTLLVFGPLSFQTLAQQKVYFPYFELISLDKDIDIQYSTSRLVKSYTEDSHDINILLPESNDSYYAKETFFESIENAKAFGADHVMLGEIHGLGNLFIVSLGLYEVSSGNKVWHDMVKGRSTEDLDPLLSRLGRNFNTSIKAKDDVEISEVTEYEQQGVELAQVKVNHFVGLLIGGTYLFGEQTSSGFGISYSYDATSVLFNVNFEFYPSSGILNDDNGNVRRIRNGNFNLGVLYPLSKKRMTWYLQGAMEYGFINVYRDEPELNKTNAGVGLYLGAGYLINRNSTVNLRINAGLSIPTYSVDGQSFPGLKFGLITSFSKKR